MRIGTGPCPTLGRGIVQLVWDRPFEDSAAGPEEATVCFLLTEMRDPTCGFDGLASRTQGIVGEAQRMRDADRTAHLVSVPVAPG